MRILSTIGYESATLEDFVATLTAANIDVLIDVRQVAGSRRKGFSKTALGIALNAVGIKYVHLRGLGDPKDGRIAAREGRYDEFEKIFSSHMTTNEYINDLNDAVDIINNCDACLMCYERDYNFCHRKLVASSISAISKVSISHLGVRKDIAKNGTKIRKRSSAYSGESVAAC